MINMTNSLNENYMNELTKLIDKYLEVGEYFLNNFFNDKKIKIPNSNMDWVSAIFNQKGRLKDGTVYFKHGFGIDFQNKNWQISLDFGPKGEWDGFNAWKLQLFIKTNNISSSLQYENKIQKLLDRGIKDGIFIKKDSFYFKK